MEQLKRLIREIHRRSLWQVLAIYLAASWAVLEAADVLIERLALPGWIYGLAIVLLLVGLPVVLATALVQEGAGGPSMLGRGGTSRPTGRESRSLPALSAPRGLFTWRNAIAGGVLAFALWGIVAAGWLLLHREREPATRIMAVLPFENLGSPEDEYFADGLSEEITARLARLEGLAVIARTSAVQYKDTKKTVPEIGKELGVDYILEGTVRWEHRPKGSSRVRVTPQLIGVEDGTHLWAEVYEEPLSGVFHVQADIAERVAKALNVTLLEADSRALEFEPTKHLRAYDYYLRGKHFFRRSFKEEDFRLAIDLYGKAVELDPQFALAYAWLSRTHCEMYWFFHDRSTERVAEAKRAADLARQLDPDLPEVSLALGYYYYHCQLDYDRALEHLEQARRDQPRDAEVIAAIAYVQRRQSKFEEAAKNLERAMELDPRAPEFAFTLAETYQILRDHATAERLYDRALSLGPDWEHAYGKKASFYMAWLGDTRKARGVLEEVARVSGRTEEPFVILAAVQMDIYEGRYREALERLASLESDALESQYFLIPTAQLAAQVHGLLNEPELRRAYFDSARVLLEDRLQERPEDARLHSALGIAYGGLGRQEDAIAEGLRGVELLPVSREAWRGLYRVEDLARIYTMVGEYEAAIEQLDFMLSRPGDFTTQLLRLDPLWDPLRNHPGFAGLLQRYE